MDYLTLLIGITPLIIRILNELDARREKKLLRKIVQLSITLTTIIEDAERILSLIDNPQTHINEYGKEKYLQILKNNINNQVYQLRLFQSALLDAQLSTIISKLDKTAYKFLKTSISAKRSSLASVLFNLSRYQIDYKSNQLKMLADERTHPVFPKLDDQKMLLQDLKDVSSRLNQLIMKKATLADLL